MLPKDAEPLRLLIQGTAGVGKTFVITAITYIIRRLFGRNASVMNLAPTGAASVLLPGGRTLHSVTPIPGNKKQVKTAQLSDYPMSDKSLKKLRYVTGTKDDMKLIGLNIDERAMNPKENITWSRANVLMKLQQKNMSRLVV